MLSPLKVSRFPCRSFWLLTKGASLKVSKFPPNLQSRCCAVNALTLLLFPPCKDTLRAAHQSITPCNNGRQYLLQALIDFILTQLLGPDDRYRDENGDAWVRFPCSHPQLRLLLQSQCLTISVDALVPPVKAAAGLPGMLPPCCCSVTLTRLW
jgi:hypothetical protein